MDILSFVSSIINYTVWPLTIVVIILILKKNIFSHIGILKKIKANQFELEFEKEIKDINKIKKEKIPITNIEKETIRLARINPSLSIIESWRNVENEMKKHALNILGEKKNFRDLLKEVYFHKLIDFEDYEIIEKMIKLRNEVAHNTETVLTTRDAINYAKNCNYIIAFFKMIKEVPKIKLNYLTLLILEINALIDTGKYNNINIEIVKQKIYDENLIDYLAEITHEDSDFSFHLAKGIYGQYKEIFNKEIKDICMAYGGSERRKWGIENSGLCLIVAWTNEIIQRGTGWHPKLSAK
jgi:hypothetical protein